MAHPVKMKGRIPLRAIWAGVAWRGKHAHAICSKISSGELLVGGRGGAGNRKETKLTY